MSLEVLGLAVLSWESSTSTGVAGLSSSSLVVLMALEGRLAEAVKYLSISTL
jgi:hypothetical protein